MITNEQPKPIEALGIPISGKSQKTVVMPVIQPLEFEFATNRERLGRRIGSDTTIAMGHRNDLCQEFFQIVIESLTHAADPHIHGTLLTDVDFKKQIAAIANIAQDFYQTGGADTGAIVCHTAAWSAKAIWNAKFKVNLKCETITLEDIPLRKGSVLILPLRFGVRKELCGPPVFFRPDRLRWHRPDGLDYQLVYSERWHRNATVFSKKVGGATFALSDSFSTSYSIGECKAEWEQKLCNGITQSIETRVVTPITHGPDAKTEESNIGFVVDGVTLKLSRFFGVPQLNGLTGVMVEHVVLSLHPETLDVIYISTSRSPLHEPRTVPFGETTYGKWITQSR